MNRKVVNTKTWMKDSYQQICMLSSVIKNERKSEQAHIPHAPTLLNNAVWMAIPSISDGQSEKKGDKNCSSKGSNQHFL